MLTTFFVIADKTTERKTGRRTTGNATEKIERFTGIHTTQRGKMRGMRRGVFPRKLDIP